MALTPWILKYGYEHGAFPMGDESGNIEWYQPYRRALFPIEGMHVSRSLQRVIDRAEFVVTFDTCFERVMRGCLRPKENWITEELILLYCQVHGLGWGHSCEVWSGDELAGGLYGLAIGGCFCAESMFHRKTNASKIALYAAVNHCRQLGFKIFDAQVQNPHLASLGSFEITQREFLSRLQRVLPVQTPWSVNTDGRLS